MASLPGTAAGAGGAAAARCAWPDGPRGRVRRRSGRRSSRIVSIRVKSSVILTSGVEIPVSTAPGPASTASTSFLIRLMPTAISPKPPMTAPIRMDMAAGPARRFSRRRNASAAGCSIPAPVRASRMPRLAACKAGVYSRLWRRCSGRQGRVWPVRPAPCPVAFPPSPVARAVGESPPVAGFVPPSLPPRWSLRWAGGDERRRCPPPDIRPPARSRSNSTFRRREAAGRRSPICPSGRYDRGSSEAFGGSRIEGGAGRRQRSRRAGE